MLRSRTPFWASGYPVPLSAWFPQSRSWKRRLLDFAAEEIRAQERAGVARYREGWSRELRRRFNPQNYYLTAEGLVFFFPMYAIAPSVEGIPTFLFPYDRKGPEKQA